MREALNYTIVRLMPDLEAEEFANIGIVIFSPKTNFWDYRIAPPTFPRIAHFFSTVDANVICSSLAGVEREMQKAKDIAASIGGKEIRVFAEELFRRRESLIGYSALRAVLTVDREKTLSDLYYRFVGRYASLCP